MLAGTVYFYNKENEEIKQMDIEAYEDLSKEEFYAMIEALHATKVTLGAFYHNHHSGETTTLYEKEKKQT